MWEGVSHNCSNCGLLKQQFWFCSAGAYEGKKRLIQFCIGYMSRDDGGNSLHLASNAGLDSIDWHLLNKELANRIVSVHAELANFLFSLEKQQMSYLL